MLSLLSPAWLALLLAIPAIWWLHRSGPRAPPWRVPDLALWSTAAAQDRQRGERRQADPAWLRRAAITVLLAFALAEPVLLQPSRSVTLWVDDSLSMLMVEQGRSRLDRGLEQAATELRAAQAAPITVRTLSNPWRAYSGLDASTRGQVLEGSGLAEPPPPPARLLQDKTSHWLLTDGADAGLDEWLRTSEVEHVLRMGTAERNTGITRLSARPSLQQRESVDLQIRIQNGGVAAERRRLELLQGEIPLQHWELELEPGQHTVLSATIGAQVREITARLTPADDLAMDDRLTLPLQALRPVKVAVGAACAAPLVATLSNHPGLRLANDAPGLVVSCGDQRDLPAAVPRIVFSARSVPAPVEGELLWSQAVPLLARPELDIARLRSRGPLAPAGDGDEVLLEASGQPLILRRHTEARTIETSIDADSPGFAATPAFPMFIACLVDLALEQAMFERMAVVDRGDGASLVVGRDIVTATARQASVTAEDKSSVTWPLLLLACALLAWDLLALARQYGATAREVA